MSKEIRNEGLGDKAHKKLKQLMSCGNERVELAAAKELIGIAEKNTADTDKDIRLEVEIRVVS